MSAGKHLGRDDVAGIANPAARRTMAQRNAGAATNVPDAVIDRLLGTINTTFYTKATARSWLVDEKALTLALTWPATWLNQRAIGLPLDRYEAILSGILAEILTHGDVAAIRHFPTYLMRCVRLWFQHNGEALYEERKSIRNALDLRFLKGLSAQPAPAVDAIEVLAQAHRMLASRRPTQKARSQDDDQPTLF
jgi:hypothetical protein